MLRPQALSVTSALAPPGTRRYRSLPARGRVQAAGLASGLPERAMGGRSSVTRRPVPSARSGRAKELGALSPALRVRPPGPASRAFAERLSATESRNVTYLGEAFPVFWEEARGANVRDVDGNVYIDLTSAFGVAAAGHSHPRVVAATQAQAARLAHGMGDVHPSGLKVRLLERLARLSPWEDARGVLASAGAEAVEIALKTAQLATDQVGVIAFEGGYHGLTLGALAATSREDFRSPFTRRLREAVSFVPFPDPLRDPWGERERCLAALEDAIRCARGRGRPAGAIIVEPIQGRAGVRVPPPGFLAGGAERAREAGALLVFDEIFTGFGRTGSLFAWEDEGVAPDLLCLGKALGGGLPLSCCLGPAETMDSWPLSEGEALHTSTFLGHPLSCAASLAFLDLLEEEELAARSKTEGERFRRLLARALEGNPRVKQIRGRGLFMGVELSDGASGGPGPGPAVQLAHILLGDGILVLPAGERGEVLEITPPLTIARSQIDASIEAIAVRLRGSDEPGRHR